MNKEKIKKHTKPLIYSFIVILFYLLMVLLFRLIEVISVLLNFYYKIIYDIPIIHLYWTTLFLMCVIIQIAGTIGNVIENTINSLYKMTKK